MKKEMPIIIAGILVIMMGLFNGINIIRFNSCMGFGSVILIGLALNIATIISGVGILKFKRWGLITVIVILILQGIVRIPSVIFMLDFLKNRVFYTWHCSMFAQLIVVVSLIVFFLRKNVKEQFK